MKPTAYLVNTSRGPIVDENALIEALKNKTIKGAGLDVFENEPKISKGFFKMDNVVLTPPHRLGYRRSSFQNGGSGGAKYYRGAGRKSAAKLDKIVKLVILAVMLKLNTEIRNVFGKKLKSDRKEGKLPAVVYGKGKESKALFVNLNEFKKIWNKIEEATIVKLPRRFKR